MHKSVKRIRWYGLLLSLTILSIGSLTACQTMVKQQPEIETTVSESTEAEQQDMYLSMASGEDWSNSERGEIMSDAMNELKEKHGISITLHDRNRLGSDSKLITAAQSGTVDIVQVRPSSEINIIPEAAFLDLPGVFDSLQDWNDLYASAYRKEVEAYYRLAGLHLLDVYAFSWRNLTSERPVKSLKDMQGLTICTPDNLYQYTLWNGLGANVLPCQLSELYYMLNEGEGHAQENLLDSLLTENLTEVQRYITMTRHQPMVSVIAMNREKYESLTEEQKADLSNFISQLRDDLISQSEKMEEELLETLRHDYEIQVFEPDESLQKAIQNQYENVLETARKTVGDAQTRTFLAAVDLIKNGWN